MKFSDVLDIVRAYESALWSPSRTGVRLGCDCGCGGDSYTVESYEEEERQANDDILAAMNMCKRLGIEYDGVE